MKLDELLSRLEGVQPGRNGGFVARCPAHADRQPSLAVSTGEDGRLLLHCFAGCPPEDIVAALGLTWADLFLPSDPAPPLKPRKPRIVATYDYCDESGKLLYQVVRYQPKGFRQRRPDGIGGWHWNLKGTRRVLYRLPPLQEAEPNTWVFVVEGEKDADRLAVLGLRATCNAGGAGKWREDYSRTFRQRRVCLLPDADEPGRVHATQVASSLLQHGVSAVKVVELPGLPEKGDVSDWLDAGGTREQIWQLVEKAPDFAPERDPDPRKSPGGDFHCTDWGNAQRLVARHGRDLRYSHAGGQWLVWNGRCWQPDATGEIVRRAKDTVAHLYQQAGQIESAVERQRLARWALQSESETRLRAMVSLAQSEPGLPVRSSELDNHPWLLNVANGTLDLRTGTLHPHRREDFLTRWIPVQYDPAAPCSTWRQFLQRILDHNDSLISFLQRAIGYTLTGDTSEQCLFLLYGIGANGKSTFLNTLAELLADYALQTPTETLTLHRGDTIPNDLARLPGARFVVAVETEDGKRLAESRLKQMTGGEPLVARFLRQEWFEFQPCFKLFLATNHKPQIRGTDAAIWRRLRLLPFTITIPEKEQDRNLPQKLRREFPGILAWAVQGCLAWQQQGLGIPPEIRQATAEYRAEQDLLAAFLQDCCRLSPAAWVAKQALYRVYVPWCQARGERPESQRALSHRLKERGIADGRGGANSEHRWYGLGLSGTDVTDTTDPVFPTDEAFPA